jgi:hypothetical protein
MLKVLFVILSLGFTAAHAAASANTIHLKEVEIIDAYYLELSSGSRTIEVVAKYNGGCENDTRDTNIGYDLRVNACTEIVPHDKCVASFLVAGDVSCVNPITKIFVLPREELVYNKESLDSKKFDNTKIIIKGKNSEKEIQLKRI